MRLFIDVETIPTGEKLTVEELKLLAPKTMSKAETIQKWAEENVDDEFRKRALDEFKGRLLCIGMCWENESEIKVLYAEDEVVLLDKLLAEMLTHCNDQRDKLSSIKLVAYNALFDTKFLYYRSLVHKHQLAKYLPKHVKSSRIEDLMQEFTFGQYNSFVSLDRACKIIAISGKEGDMDGSRVYDEYLAGNIEKICEYCGKDVQKLIDIDNYINSI